MENHFGGYVRDITPIGRGRKKYMAEHGLPAYFIGVDLPGGTKVNSNVEYINGEFRYERAGQLRSRMELETRYTEVELIASAKKLLKMRKGRKAALTARGRVMGQIPATKNENVLIKEAVYTYNKYEGMFARGEQRERRNANGTVYYQDAAHPSEWGMGILFEGKIVTKGKAKNGKK